MDFQSFSMRTESKGDSLYVFFTGTLNEDAYSQYVKLVENLPNSVVFDFGGVGFINSTGVRDWIKFIRQIEPGRTIRFEKCTDSLIGNINLMPYMAGKSIIGSVLRNCTCNACGTIDAILLLLGRDYSSDGALKPAPNCRNCSSQLTWDIPDQEYYLFVKPN